MTVTDAPAQTIAARTARVLYEIRVNSPDGKPIAAQRQEAGVVDFARRHVHYSTTTVTRKSEYPGEILWLGPDTFSGNADAGTWRQIRSLTTLSGGDHNRSHCVTITPGPPSPKFHGAWGNLVVEEAGDTVSLD